MRSPGRWLAAALAVWAAAGEEIRIGYFGPADDRHPLGGSMWKGVSLAFEDHAPKRPLRLMAVWDENPWTGGAGKLAKLIYEEHTAALIGGIDGTSTHLAEQIVAKALLPQVDPASTDRTVNAAFVPWIFSVMPDDRALMRVLVDGMLAAGQRPSFVLISSTDHDSRITRREFLLAAERRLRPQRAAEFHPGKTNLPALIDNLTVEAAVVLAGPADSAAVVRELRRLKPELRIYCGPAAGSRTFLELAGGAAEGVRFPDPLERSERAAGFARRFTERWGEPPDYLAFHAYDAGELLIEAIRRAGANREAIRDALRGLSPWSGVSGRIEWDKLGRNSRPASLAEIRRGARQPASPLQ
jgi:branched-chain amino acid transport system substrate-binding protein